MRVYTTKSFRRIAKQLGIVEPMLVEAVGRAESGLVDVDYKYGVIKQRIARAGQGKRGGYRAVLIFEVGHRAVFLDAGCG